jgi:AcrR family transcriptional regulator
MTVKRRPYESELRSAAAEETRSRIVAAARAMLGEEDSAPTFSLDAIARRAGTTRLTIYNQFASRRGLLEVVFDDMAREGGLFELSSVFVEPDIGEAIRRFVSVFCKFWALRRKPMPRLLALARLDDEFAESFHQRLERRREALAVLVRKLPRVPSPTVLIDLLFVATSFETFESLSVRGRGRRAVEALVQQLVADIVSRHSAHDWNHPARASDES